MGIWLLDFGFNWVEANPAQKQILRDFPDGPVAETPPSQRGLIPDQETRSYIQQLRVCMPKLKISHAARRSKIPHATTNTRCSQITILERNRSCSEQKVPACMI